MNLILLPPHGGVVLAAHDGVLGREDAAALGVDVVEDLARELDVVVGELANLGVVDAEDLGLLGRAQRQAGNHVHDEEDEAGADKRVAAARERVGQLDGQLHPVVVEPAALDGRHAVERGDVVCGEEGRQDVADEAADAVHGKDVERVVDAEEELELGGVVGERGAEDAVDDSGPDGDVA